MAVETTPQVANNRMSIRITTKDSFHIGSLLILSATHMPTGCAYVFQVSLDNLDTDRFLQGLGKFHS
jgi:hypothetical protein